MSLKLILLLGQYQSTLSKIEEMRMTAAKMLVLKDTIESDKKSADLSQSRKRQARDKIEEAEEALKKARKEAHHLRLGLGLSESSSEPEGH
jgi:uncharacterized protein YbjQ (UPF0145 family)